MNRFKLALCVGHSWRAPGAARHGISEFSYNSNLVPLVRYYLRQYDATIETRIFSRPGLEDNAEAIRHLAKQVNEWKADYCIEFHINACPKPSIDGHAVLIYKGTNLENQVAAKMIRNCLGKVFNNPRHYGTGTKEVASNENGGILLQGTRMPCVLVEPFFLSNKKALFNGMRIMDYYADKMAAVLSSVCQFYLYKREGK